MNIKLDKEKLTAYVLGELGQGERAEVEKALADDETARRQVEEIRAAAEITRELFAGAPELTLSNGQREAIASRAVEAGEDEGVAKVLPLKKKAASGRFNWPILRAAAVFLVVIGAGAVVFYPQYDKWRMGVPLSTEISPQSVGRRAMDAGKPQPRHLIIEKSPDTAEGRADDSAAVKPDSTGVPADQLAGKEKSAAAVEEAVDQFGYEMEQTEVKEATAASAGKKGRQMDESTGDRLRALGYMKESGEILVTAEAPVIEPQRISLGGLPTHGGVQRSGAVAGGVASPPANGGRAYGMTSAMEKQGTFGYQMEADASIDDPNLNHWPGHNTEAYDRIVDNPFKAVGENPLSTFSIDVDTASYANMRRFINQGQLPPKDSVRIEELVNYFDYDYEPPRGDTPFAAHVMVAGCPWKPGHRLARVGLKGWEMARDQRPASNLVFLLDVSGSMNTQSKLPLLKQAMGLLVEQLGEKDSVAIAVYAGASGLVLPPTSGDNQRAILGALDRLQAGGSTNGGAGIELAYDLAVQNFIKSGVNRVILATDGDFNVGTTNRGDLIRMIEDKAKSGVFLTVLGFGMGNLKDATMENLADKGNGNYAYIDTIREAKKVLVDEIGSTMVTIAKDVKIQVEFNPAEVAAYRLIGYENRILAAEDFNDDTKDAGEIGAGHTVTALYELVPPGVEIDLPNIDPLKYQKTTKESREARSGELFTIKLRYKEQDGDKSKLLSFPVTDQGTSYASASPDFKFAAAVASFGMILRDSEHKGQSDIPMVLELAEDGQGRDRHGYRAEFIELVRKTRSLR